MLTFTKMTTHTIKLRDEDQAFLARALKSGRYVSESEAVADAFAELRARESLRASRIAELRAKVQEGVAELDRGEGAEWSAEEIKSEGRELLAARKASAN